MPLSKNYVGTILAYTVGLWVGLFNRDAICGLKIVTTFHY